MATTAYPLTLMQHEGTGHYIATCETLLPFIAQGSTLDELRDNARIVIRRILEKQGNSVSSVEISPQPPHIPDSIQVADITAVAVFEAA